MTRKDDTLLDAYGRLLRALMVLHYEAETDMDFDAYVELANVRYDAAVQTRIREPVLEAHRICPEAGCEGNYEPVGEVFRIGHDHNGVSVMGRRWACDGKKRHYHTVEEK